MADIHTKCRGCGLRFIWTDKEQDEFAANASPDTEDEATGDLIEVEPYCKTCRPKQDGQRS